MKQGLVKIVLLAVIAGAIGLLFEPILAPVFAVLVAWTVSPLVRKQRIWFVGEVENEHSVLFRRRQEALRMLKDLEDDRAAGKVSDSEFDAQRPEMMDDLRDLTRRLDELATKRKNARSKLDRELSKNA